MNYEPLHHKYRPQTFADLVGQTAIATTLTNALHQERIAPAYLFCGPRGTGKTSSARILAKSLNCLNAPKPTPRPCGVCDVCQAIAHSSALDVIEIDAASNTGVDNIRELIEKSQFAPVQCRYKVYVIDECLTGDSLIVTDQGLYRIDNPEIKYRNVLSYNEKQKEWEFRPILNWFNQGKRPTFLIKTPNHELRCTGNHLIRTDRGWIAADKLRPGMKILTPSPITSGKLQHLPQSAPVAVANNSLFRPISSNPTPALKPFTPTGTVTHTKKDMVFGCSGLKTIFNLNNQSPQKFWDLSTAHYWGMDQSLIPTNIVAIPGCVGRMEFNNRNGYLTKPSVYPPYTPNFALPQTKAGGQLPLPLTQPVILSLCKSSMLLNPLAQISTLPRPGCQKLAWQAWPGGTWMMAPLVSPQPVAPKFTYIPRAIPTRKTNSWQNGVRPWATQQKLCFSANLVRLKDTTISRWEQTQPENGWMTSAPTLCHQWTTSLAVVESVHRVGVEAVYDIEVEGNHNFVANGLLVHNCHMLSTSAFNALLKTLEEPPDRVIFVLATTDPQRVLPTIISRCQRFDFRRIPLADMVTHLTHIAQLETININPEAVNLVAQIAQGGLRDAESLLDQLSLLDGEITIERVWDLAGSVPEQDLFQLLQAIKSQHPEILLEQTRQLLERGREPLIVLQNLTGFYRDFLIAKTAPNRQDLVAITPDTWNALCEFAQSWSSQEILAGQQHLRACELQIKNTTQPRLWLEVGLLGLLSLPQTDQTASPPVQIARPAPQPPTIPAPISPAPIPPVANAILPTAPPPRPPATPNFVTPPPSTPTSVTPPTPSPPGPTANSAEINLSQLWQQGIQLVQFPGTQALLSQHGQLLSCTDREIRISLPTPGLLKLTQKYQDKIEVAFQKALGKPVKVRLEVATSVPEKAAPPPTPQSKPTPLTPPAPSPAPPQAPSLALNQPDTPVLETPAPEFNPAPPDALSQATQSFARFFAGEIVSLEPGSPPTPLEPVSLNSNDLSPTTDETDLPPDLEEDMPF